MPLPPVKPRNSPRSPAGNSGRKSLAAVKAVGPVAGTAPAKELVPAVAVAVNRDEDEARDKLVRHEQIAFIALSASHHQSAYVAVVSSANSMCSTFTEAASAFESHNRLANEVRDELKSQTAASLTVNDKLTQFIDFSQGESSRRLRELEQQCAVLTRELELKTREADTVASENKSLTHTINQRLVKCDLQFEQLRQEVRDAIEKNRIDFQSVRQQLYQRIDSAVLQYHKPQFDTALHDIRSYQTEVGRDVLEHTRRLTHVIDEIGSTGVTVEAKSLHTQIPTKVRASLAALSKDQLLNLVDVLSFEEGVVAAVARGVAAHEAADARSVFR